MKTPSKLIAVLAAISLMTLGAVAIEVFRVSTAHAGNARRSDLNEYMRQLNGSPRKLGVITGAGAADESNATTASAFTIPRGETVFVVCDVDAFCHEHASAASTSYTNAAMAFPLTASKPWPMIMKGGSGNVDALWCAATAAWNCAVFSMD